MERLTLARALTWKRRRVYHRMTSSGELVRGESIERKGRHSMAKGRGTGAFLRGRKAWTLAIIGLGLAVAAAVIFVAWSAGAAPTDSGVKGRVWLGPLSPVQRVGGPANDRPYPATLEVLGSDKRVVTTVRSSQDGYFKVDLRQGAYVLQGVSGGNGFPHANTASVTVVAHRFTTVRVEFDTGIR